MKYLKKYCYHIVCTVSLLLIVIVGLVLAYSKPTPHLYFESEAGVEKISIFESEAGCSYVFLPAFVSLGDIKFDIPSSLSVYLDSTSLSTGDSCKDIVLEHEYSFRVDDRITSLIFCRSSNIASLFIDTATGTMEHIHLDQAREEYAKIRMYSEDGTLEYSSPEAIIKGRGNSTWDEQIKKPYLLTLPEPGSILDMPPSTKWVLLANSEDESHLRNKIVFDTANNLLPGFAPESRYVDLYLNGEYAGLYLLAEKIGLESNLPEINVNDGDFLCSIEIDYRVAGLITAFQTNSGRTVEIIESNDITAEDMSRIHDLVNSMEQAILSGDTEALASELDVDSWARRYMIDEIFANADADKSSSYFYYSDGLFYAGPLWDYDLSFGDFFGNAKFFSYPARFVNSTFPYINALSNNKLFYDRVIELYSSEALPLIQELISQGIAYQHAFIEDSAKMDLLRYSPESTPASTPLFSVQEMCDYLESRINFLSAVWIEGKEYLPVVFRSPSGSVILHASAERGTTLSPNLFISEYTQWIDTSTGEIFDFNQPILSDKEFRAVDNAPLQSSDTLESNMSANDNTHISRRGIVFLSIICIFSFLVLLLITDIRRTRERNR